jgi:hypothetical protein
MEAEANYKLTDEQSNVKSEGQAKAILDENYLTLMVTFGEPMLFAYTDIINISEGDYKINLHLSSKEKLNLAGLGYEYENFLRELFRLRNELLLRYMLMEESLVKAGFEGQFAWFDAKGQLNQTGECEIRLYETALVILPQKAEPIRVPFCYITQTSKADYKLVVADEFGEKYEFFMLGEKFDALARELSNALNKLMVRSQQTLKELDLGAHPVFVSKLAALMKDGRAAKRKDIEQLLPNLWRKLTKSIAEAGLSEEYGFLEAKAQKEQICVGVKRGLMGDLTGSYVWLLIPLLNLSGKLENAVALEAFTTGQAKAEAEPENASVEENTDAQDVAEPEVSAGGKATYFFKLLGRSDYAKASAEEVAARIDGFTKNINRCMVDINFRREPIYLSEDKLDSPKYVQYRYAVAKLPSLKTLRRQFIGRVVHSTFDQWKQDVTDLLDFNAHSQDDSQKWRKRGE